MTKQTATITETQKAILTVAFTGAKTATVIIPVPTTLRGGAKVKVAEGLIARNLAKTIVRVEGMGAGWYKDAHGDEVGLVTTDHAAEVLGLTFEAPEAEQRTPKTREGTKQARFIEMLRAVDGASVEEVSEALGWQHHTVRGAMAGALKKKLGLEVTSKRVEGRGRVYRLA